jgi:hypothetical protein
LVESDAGIHRTAGLIYWFEEGGTPMRWEFVHDSTRAAYASGTDSPSVLELAFLTWLDGRDVRNISNPGSLAAFLAHYSTLTHRQLAGLLGSVGMAPVRHATEFNFRYQDEPVTLSRQQTTDDSSEGYVRGGSSNP